MYEIVLCANFILWVVIVFLYIRTTIASAFHPVSYYLFFHGFIFTFRPLVVYFNNYTQLYRGYQFSPSIDDKITVILASMLGLICFVGTALKFGNYPLNFKQNIFNDEERNQLKSPFLFTVAILAPLGVIAALSSWNTRTNDSTTMILDAATGRFINTTSSGYFVDFQLLLAPLAVICVWLYRFQWWTFVVLAAFVVLRAGTGTRWPLLMACASVSLMFLYENRQKIPSLKSLTLVFVAMWLFQIVGVDRGASIRNIFTDDNRFSSKQIDSSDLGFLEGMDFANLEYFEYIVYVVPQRSGTYDYFLDNLQIFTEPMPRKFWPEKPVGPPIQLFTLFDYGYPIGMSYSLPGEGWMQLGYLGVAIWCGLFGWFYGWVYAKFQQSKHSNLSLIAFLLFIPLSLQFFRDGLLLTMVKTHAWFLLPVILVYGFARLSAVPLADELRQMALRRAARRQPDIAARILARRGGGRMARASRLTHPAE